VKVLAARLGTEGWGWQRCGKVEKIAGRKRARAGG
jgi:hypothetical protein